MSNSADMAVEISDGILFTSFEGGRYILLEIDRGNYFELEGTAGFLWSLWRKDSSVAHSIEELADRYDVDRVTAEADVLDLIADLERNQLITVSGRA
jgi:hypothetical protein